jgi:predicted RNase H-related nuclease YkuK (DUF458 family)
MRSYPKPQCDRLKFFIDGLESVSVEQAALILGSSKSTAFEKLVNLNAEPIRIGNRYFFKKEEVEKIAEFREKIAKLEQQKTVLKQEYTHLK